MLKCAFNWTSSMRYAAHALHVLRCSRIKFASVVDSSPSAKPVRSKCGSVMRVQRRAPHFLRLGEEESFLGGGG